MISQFHIYSLCSFLFFQSGQYTNKNKVKSKRVSIIPIVSESVPRLATVFHLANATAVGGLEKGQRGGVGRQRGLGEQAVDTLMDLSLASHNHSPGHSRTEGEREGETEEGRQRQKDGQRREKDRV